MEVIEVNDVWKRFKIPHEKKETVFENLQGILHVFERKRFTYEEFWALKGVNFSVDQGESIGIIGENGSGKSTLLEIIANILRPDKGTVKTAGKIASILALALVSIRN